MTRRQEVLDRAPTKEKRPKEKTKHRPLKMNKETRFQRSSGRKVGSTSRWRNQTPIAPVQGRLRFRRYRLIFLKGGEGPSMEADSGAKASLVFTWLYSHPTRASRFYWFPVCNPLCLWIVNVCAHACTLCSLSAGADLHSPNTNGICSKPTLQKSISLKELDHNVAWLPYHVLLFWSGIWKGTWPASYWE